MPFDGNRVSNSKRVVTTRKLLMCLDVSFGGLAGISILASKAPNTIHPIASAHTFFRPFHAEATPGFSSCMPADIQLTCSACTHSFEQVGAWAGSFLAPGESWPGLLTRPSTRPKISPHGVGLLSIGLASNSAR